MQSDYSVCHGIHVVIFERSKFALMKDFLIIMIIVVIIIIIKIIKEEDEMIIIIIKEDKINK